MAFGEMWIELAKLRADDLRDERRRVGRDRRQPAGGGGVAALQARTGRLVHWLQQGQIGTGIDDLSEAPVTARCV
jgi:hypothetical protein